MQKQEAIYIFFNRNCSQVSLSLNGRSFDNRTVITANNACPHMEVPGSSYKIEVQEIKYLSTVRVVAFHLFSKHSMMD